MTPAFLPLPGPRRARRANPETILQSSILKALTLRFKKSARFWRNNTGAVRNERGQLIRYGLGVGSPDIVGIIEGGRAVFLEVKTSGGKPTPEQEFWLRDVGQLGAVAGVVRSIEDAFSLVSQALKEQERASPAGEAPTR